MTGVELYERLTASGCRCPLILITGRDDEAPRAMAKRVSAVALLGKPFDKPTLLTAICRGLWGDTSNSTK